MVYINDNSWMLYNQPDYDDLVDLSVNKEKAVLALNETINLNARIYHPPSIHTNTVCHSFA